jgi:voltage-gated potassium channel Kch
MDQRAWVGPVEMVEPQIREGHTLVFEIIVTNSGKTLARKVSTNVMTKSFPVGARFIPEYPVGKGRQPHEGGAIVVFPGMKVSLTTPPIETLTKEAIEALRTNRIVLYIFGKITYEDVFGKSHLTTFCYFLRPEIGRPQLATISACKTYNEAD